MAAWIYAEIKSSITTIATPSKELM